MADQDPEGVTPRRQTNHSSMYLYIGMATGALTAPGAIEHLTKSINDGGVNRAYIEYLRDKLSEALKDYP